MLALPAAALEKDTRALLNGGAVTGEGTCIPDWAGVSLFRVAGFCWRALSETGCQRRTVRKGTPRTTFGSAVYPEVPKFRSLGKGCSAARKRGQVASWRESPPGDLTARWVWGTSGKETAVLQKGTGWQARGREELDRIPGGMGNLNWQRRIEIRKWHQGGVSQAWPQGETQNLAGCGLLRLGHQDTNCLCQRTLPLLLVLPGLQVSAPFPSSRVPFSSPDTQIHTLSSKTQCSQIQALCGLGRGGLAFNLSPQEVEAAEWRVQDQLGLTSRVPSSPGLLKEALSLK